MVYRVAVAAERRPFAYVNPLRDGQAKFAGFLVDLLPRLFLEAGLNASEIEYYQPPTDASGNVLKNGSWTGLTGELTSGRADIILSQITARSVRFGIVDQSISVIDAQKGMLTLATNTRPTDPFTFLQPFDWQLWVCLALMTFGMALLLTILSKLSPMGCFDLRKICTTKKGDGSSGDTREYAVHDVTKSFLLDTWMTATGQTPLPNGRSWAVRMVGVSYGLFSLLVIASYTASFASILTTSSRHYTLRSLDDLSYSGKPFGIDAGGNTLAFYSNPHNAITARLSPHYKEFKNVYEALPALRNGTIAAFLGQVTNLQYIANLQPCDLAVVDKGWGYGSQVLMYQKNSELTAPLDEAIIKLREKGDVDQIFRGWTSQQCPLFGVGASARLELTSFAGLWYMLFIFWGVAIAVALTEQAVVALGHRYPEMRRRNAKVSNYLFGAGGKHFNFGDDTFELPNSASQRMA